MLGTNHGKTRGKWRKPERRLGANHDDAVNMLENAVKVQENVITTRRSGRKRGLKSDGQSIVKTYKREESNHRKR